jgi:hypothetical protein
MNPIHMSGRYCSAHRNLSNPNDPAESTRSWCVYCSNGPSARGLTVGSESTFRDRTATDESQPDDHTLSCSRSASLASEHDGPGANPEGTCSEGQAVFDGADTPLLSNQRVR